MGNQVQIRPDERATILDYFKILESVLFPEVQAIHSLKSTLSVTSWECEQSVSLSIETL